MYVTVPSVLKTTVPWVPCVTEVTTALGPKVSLARTLIVPDVSSSIVVVSLKASCTGFTVTATVDVEVPPLPSVIVYVIVSVPLKSSLGV